MKACDECPWFFSKPGLKMVQSPGHLWCEVRDGVKMFCHKDSSKECQGAIYAKQQASKRFILRFLRRWK